MTRLFDVGEPTPTERAERRRVAAGLQQTLDVLDDLEERWNRCHACSGEHPTDQCPHGTALALEVDR